MEEIGGSGDGHSGWKWKISTQVVYTKRMRDLFTKTACIYFAM
jgi:hypothetical protein